MLSLLLAFKTCVDLRTVEANTISEPKSGGCKQSDHFVKSPIDFLLFDAKDLKSSWGAEGATEISIFALLRLRLISD
jgi:hypothetical protein